MFISLNIKKIRAIEVPSKEDVFNNGRYILRVGGTKSIDFTALYYHLYLFGQRISEALATKIKDFEFKRMKYKRRDVLLVVLKSINLKTKKVYLKRKTLPVVIDKYHELEGKMFNFVYKTMIKGRKDDEYVFHRIIKYHPTYVNYYFKRYSLPFKVDVVFPNGEYAYDFHYALHPHFLRHCRLTHLVEDEHFDAMELMKFAGWTTPAPAVIYDKSTEKRMVDKMLKRR